jgi:hypothetical protein
LISSFDDWVIINTDCKIATILRPNNHKVRLFIIYNCLITCFPIAIPWV